MNHTDILNKAFSKAVETVKYHFKFKELFQLDIIGL